MTYRSLSAPLPRGKQSEFVWLDRGCCQRRVPSSTFACLQSQGHLLTLSVVVRPAASSLKASAARSLLSTDGAQGSAALCSRWTSTSSEFFGSCSSPVAPSLLDFLPKVLQCHERAERERFRDRRVWRRRHIAAPGRDELKSSALHTNAALPSPSWYSCICTERSRSRRVYHTASHCARELLSPRDAFAQEQLVPTHRKTSPRQFLPGEWEAHDPQMHENQEH